MKRAKVWFSIRPSSCHISTFRTDESVASHKRARRTSAYERDEVDDHVKSECLSCGATDKALPLSLTFTGTDVTNNTTLFSGTQSKGQAQGSGGTIVQCSSTQTSTATEDDVAQAPGIISVGDTLQFTVNVTAVIKAH